MAKGLGRAERANDETRRDVQGLRELLARVLDEIETGTVSDDLAEAIHNALAG